MMFGRADGRDGKACEGRPPHRIVIENDADSSFRHRRFTASLAPGLPLVPSSGRAQSAEAVS